MPWNRPAHNVADLTYPMTREQALDAILKCLKPDTLCIGTTGKTSRELFELRKRLGTMPCDFLTVGGMGHASSIGLAVSNAQPHKVVVVFDGDGAALMHLGAMAIIGKHNKGRFLHIVLNNGCHESVGGQPTAARHISLPDVATACGYHTAQTVTTLDELHHGLDKLCLKSGPVLLEVMVRPGSRDDLGRPTSSPMQNKHAFMNHILQ